jgi:hypothetical protein
MGSEAARVAPRFPSAPTPFPLTKLLGYGLLGNWQLNRSVLEKSALESENPDLPRKGQCLREPSDGLRLVLKRQSQHLGQPSSLERRST